MTTSVDVNECEWVDYPAAKPSKSNLTKIGKLFSIKKNVTLLSDLRYIVYSYTPVFILLIIIYCIQNCSLHKFVARDRPMHAFFHLDYNPEFIRWNDE